MLSVIVHGEGVKIILILQIHSHKTNCIFVALIDLARFLSYENSRAGCSHSHMHAHSKGHAISQDRIRGRACAWPIAGVQNKVSHQEQSMFHHRIPRRARHTQGDGKSVKVHVVCQK